MARVKITSRLLRGIVLPLLLVFAQQGAMLHELSHYAAAATHDSEKQHLPGGEVCSLCLAFAHLGAGLAPNVPVLPTLDLLQAPAPLPEAICIAAERPAACSRGPPSLL